MTRAERAEAYRKLRDEGKNYDEIAAMFGVSHQAVAQVCGRYQIRYWRPLTETGCIYPGLRDWLNNNKVNKAELLRRMGLGTYDTNYQRLSARLRGKGLITKDFIDRLSEITGMTYDEMFAEHPKLVRCRDCKWRKEAAWAENRPYCGNPHAGIACGVDLREGDYCSYGERGEGNG